MYSDIFIFHACMLKFCLFTSSPKSLTVPLNNKIKLFYFLLFYYCAILCWTNIALDTYGSEFDNDYKVPEIRVIENTILLLVSTHPLQ